MSLRGFLATAALCLLAVAGSGGGDEPPSAREADRARSAYALARDLMSPYCPGRTLADCPSPDAAALRDEIRQRISAGTAPEEVRRDLEQRFGDAVRGVPRGPLAWGVPALLLVAGAVVLALALRRLSLSSGNADAAIPPELEREIERELRERGL
jgi:cytochrome c-type biogenesis protein CcmH/NrfF